MAAKPLRERIRCEPIHMITVDPNSALADAGKDVSD